MDNIGSQRQSPYNDAGSNAIKLLMSVASIGRAKRFTARDGAASTVTD